MYILYTYDVISWRKIIFKGMKILHAHKNNEKKRSSQQVKKAFYCRFIFFPSL